MSVRTGKGLLVACLVLSIGFLFGCAGREFAPKQQIWYYHSELPAADRALAAAKAAGKDKECPEAYAYVGKMRDDAYKLYWACNTKEAIAKANEATAMAKGLCPALPLPEPVKVMAPPPPPVVAPPPAAPVATISADSKYVYEGKCTTLKWSTQNATSAMIDPGIGSVGPSGTKEICPKETTKYTITATNPGGTSKADVEVPVYHRTTIHINFDTNKAEIRKADMPELQKAVEFVKKYPDTKISVVGFTDSTGSDAYNQKLSQRRADAVKKYLVDTGHVKADMISAEGRGEADPIANNKTKEGRFKNRRVEISEQGK